MEEATEQPPIYDIGACKHDIALMVDFIIEGAQRLDVLGLDRLEHIKTMREVMGPFAHGWPKPRVRHQLVLEAVVSDEAQEAEWIMDNAAVRSVDIDVTIPRYDVNAMIFTIGAWTPEGMGNIIDELAAHCHEFADERELCIDYDSIFRRYRADMIWKPRERNEVVFTRVVYASITLHFPTVTDDGRTDRRRLEHELENCERETVLRERVASGDWTLTGWTAEAFTG